MNILKALQSGMQLILDFVLLENSVIERGLDDQNTMEKFLAVRRQWAIELAGVHEFADAVKSKKVDEFVMLGMVVGRDPFKASRMMLRKLQVEYK